MKINVDANSFCPNDCPYFEIQYTKHYELGGEMAITRYCTHEHLCKFAVDQYRNKVEVDNDKNTE